MKSDSAVQAHRRLVAAQITPYRTLLLAFSGGLDSTVLLDALIALRDGDDILYNVESPALRAVYIHHGLSRYADRWAAYCAHECRRRNVAFTTVRVVLDWTSEGIEAAARKARYHALAEMLMADEVLLTAQHQDDQAETLLLALKRGSGPAGLAAMAANAPFRGHRLLRPLLGCSRTELETYARARGLCWIEDDSNSDLRFDRNFLRLQILPPLRQRWPQFTATVARSAQLCAEQEQLLDELLADTLKALTQPDGSLRLKALRAMSNIRRAAILRRWLANCGVRMPSRQQLARLWREVALSRCDAVAQMQIDDRHLRRFRDRLYVLPRLPEISDGIGIFPWPTQNEWLTLPAGLGKLYRRPVDINIMAQDKSIATLKYNNPLGISLDGSIGFDTAAAGVASNANPSYDVDIAADEKITERPIVVNTNYNDSLAVREVFVRAPMLDERVSVRFGPVRGLLYITGRRRGRILKKIWQELDIPPWRRINTPLLFYNDQLIAALGVFVTWEGAVRESEAQWHLFWLAASI